MSSVARGNSFEDRVFAALQTEVNAERLGLLPRQCTLFQKKGYFSRDRQSDIVTDISIEVTLPGANAWSILWVCECKDYSGAIPVNDVEEFKAKLDQIAGKNVKGLMAITGVLQSGADVYARSNGIGVVRIMPVSQVTWVMYLETSISSGQSTLSSAEFSRAFSNPNHRSSNREFYGRADGYIFDGWSSLLKKVLSGGLS